MSCASSSLRRRMRSGAFHPVLRLRVYSTPCRVRLRVRGRACDVLRFDLAQAPDAQRRLPPRAQAACVLHALR